MKVKKQKQHRRAVRFYSACFGFREPYKVLCDGTFVNHLLVNGIIPADTALAKTLGGTVKLFTTRCALIELKTLGESLSETFNTASNLVTARCDHEKRRKSARDCMSEVIGDNNPEHFFVATLDKELIKKFQEIPGVPVIYAHRNALFLEKPSTSQKQFAKTAEENRLHMTDLELKMLKLKKKVAPEEAEGASDANVRSNIQIAENGAGNANFKTKRTVVKDKPQFKRKKAKGPNPLSCKKKKTQQTTNTASEKESKNVDETTRRNRSRKRQRSRKSKSVGEEIV